MVIVNYIFISCGCTTLAQRLRPQNSLINPELFNCSKEIAVYKLVAIAPLFLMLNFVITMLMGFYLEFYTKQILILHTTNTKALTSLAGCFD